MNKENKNTKTDKPMAYDTLLGVVVGQKVYLEPRNYSRVKKEPIEVEVEKVGRKYFTLKGRPSEKYKLSDGVEHNEVNYKGLVSLTIQVILDRKEMIKVSDELKKICSVYGTLPYDLQTLRNVLEILKGNNA